MEWNVITKDEEMLHNFPSEEGEYLFTDGENVVICDFCMEINDDGQNVCWLDNWDIDRVTAWMELPKPYKK